MAILRIIRARTMGSTGPIKILLDGQEIGVVSNAESKDFEIPNGTHSLVAKIDFRSSSETIFTVAKDDIKTITVSKYRFALPVMLVTAVGLIALITLTDRLGDIGIVLLTVPLILLGLYQMYYITFGRNKFLVLKSSLDS